MKMKSTTKQKDRIELPMGDSAVLVDVLSRYFPLDARFTAVEVGVHRGETSRLLLQTFPNLYLTMVDSWCEHLAGSEYRKSGDRCAKLTQKQQDENRDYAREITQFAELRRAIIPFPSLETAEVYSHQPVRWNVAFIDGDHTLQAVRDDIAAWWPLVLPGGLMCGHDIDHPRDQRGVWGVRRAVEEHCRRCELQLNTQGTVWWVTKPKS